MPTRSSYPKPVANDNPYLEHAETIEAALKWICRQKRLTHDDGDEFSSYARLRLIEDNYSVLRAFRGESKIKTYLLTVLGYAYLDWRNHEQGKWRNSAKAKALGPLAMEMEKLIGRDAVDYADAVRLLIARGIAASEAQCDDTRAQLNPRPPRRPVDSQVLEQFPSVDVDPVEHEHRRHRSATVSRALSQAKSQLPPADLLILKLRFDSGFTVAKIAKLQGLEAKPLYVRFERIAAQLRQLMASQGVSEEDWADYLSDWDSGDGSGFGGNGGNGPSSLSNAGGAVA